MHIINFTFVKCFVEGIEHDLHTKKKRKGNTFDYCQYPHSEASTSQCDLIIHERNLPGISLATIK